MLQTVGLSLGLLFHAPVALRTTAARVHLPRWGSSPLLLDWPWARGDGGSSSEIGKFARHADLQPGCAPLGVVVAGLGDDELEEVAACIEDVWQGAPGEAPLSHVPIAVLAESDLRLRLRDILAELPSRDSVLPDRPAAPRVPLVLLSGFNTVQTSATVRAVRALELRGGLDAQQRPMFAVAVPNALSKTLRVLIDELEGDHRENAPPTSTDGLDHTA